MSSIQAQVVNQVSRAPEGRVFGYDALPVYRKSPGAVVKAISRMVQTGQLRRLRKGQFYKPRWGILGEVPLKDSEKLRPFLYREGRQVGYITGVSLYNRLGLTTQVPRVVTLARGGSATNMELKTFSLRVVAARAPVNKQDVPAFELLDALKDIRRIPDTTPQSALQKLMVRIEKLEDGSLSRMVELAIRFYPPMVRALLGLVLETLDRSGFQQLEGSLNPLSRYKVPLDARVWPLSRKWRLG
ncbi:hypothetical protein CEK62_04205 [Alcanivorax sp. N3-2A]|nr:hypothetical protein CEK62_04205 [Alcanivorax sp. N3-2A]